MGKFKIDITELQETNNNFVKYLGDFNDQSLEISNFNVVGGEDFDFSSALNSIKINMESVSLALETLINAINLVIENHTLLQNNTILDIDDNDVISDSYSDNNDFDTNQDSTQNRTNSNEISDEQIYVIKPGDNLTKISRMFGVSVNDLLASNSYITNPDLIYAGKTLVIPAINLISNVNSADDIKDEVVSSGEGSSKILEEETIIVNNDIVNEEKVVDNINENERIITLPNDVSTSTTTYMAWEKITSPSSNQYKLRETAKVNGDVVKDDNGFYYINDGFENRYVIATTQLYGNVGDYIDVLMEDGTVLKCVIGDIKSSGDSHYNQYGHMFSGTINVLEYITDWGNGHLNPGSVRSDLKQNVVSVTNIGEKYIY